MSRARKPRSVAIELPHSGAVRGLGTCSRTYARICSSASAMVMIERRTSSVSPDLACMSRTTGGIASSAASSA